MGILGTLGHELQHDSLTAAIVCIVVAIAYMAFAITGYGGGSLAGPVLALRLPVSKIVPLLAILDIAAAITNLANIFIADRAKADAQVDFKQLGILCPTMACGTYVGANLLRSWPAHQLLLALGLFVVVTTVRNIRAKSKVRGWSDGPPGLSWGSIGFAMIAGFFGGIFSGAFGIGGPIYALYVSSRIEAAKVAGTLGTLIGLAAAIRASIFTYFGIYGDPYLRALIVAAFPCMLVGLLGTHVATKGLPKQEIVRCLRYLLLLVGLSIVARAIPGFF